MNLKIVNGIVLGSLLFLVFTSAPRADPLDSRVMTLFPKNVTEFSYADLAQARHLTWFKPLESQLLPSSFLQFEELLESPQMGASTEIDSVVWAMAPESASSAAGADLVGAAIGHFDQQSAQSYLASHQSPSWDLDGVTIYESQTAWGSADIFFAFIDSGTVIFGPRNLVARLIEVHNGAQESLAVNDSMMILIQQVNGNGIFWSAMNGDGARQAMLQIVPGAATFTQAQQLFGKVTALLISMDNSSDTDFNLKFNAISDSQQDALVLSQLFQAGVLMRRYQASQENPALADVLNGVGIAANGNQVNLSLDITNDQMVGMMESNTFALQ